MDNFIKRVLQKLHGVQSRTFAVGLLSISLAVTVLSLSTLTRAVYIRDGEDVTLTYTTKEQPEEILQERGIITMAYDSVDFSGFSDGEVAEISIDRAFPVSLQVDGVQETVMITGGTVEELLRQQNALPDNDDILSHPMGMYLAPGDEIVVNRVLTKQTVVEEAIPFETVERETSLIPVGRTRLLQSGTEGKQTLTYEQTIVDGAVTEEVLVSNQVSVEPTDHITLVGTGAPVSDLDFGYEMDENGKPVGYQKVLTEQVATGYSAGKGAWGASGMDLHYGYVAVNPAVIPYGTKLYIATPDNSFVYGYAIAADTGIGLLQGVIDVDLYYETYLESCLNSRRIVEIYILE